LIGEHEPDALWHRNHRQAASGAGSPIQLAVAVSVSPSRGVPRIAGALVISGAVAACADAIPVSNRQTSAVATAVNSSGRVVTDRLRTRTSADLTVRPQPDQCAALVQRPGRSGM
jgi:hypothetical protein